MRKVILIVSMLLIPTLAIAQTCTYQSCNAIWPPQIGSDRTVGKDNCGQTCIKIMEPLKGFYRVYYSSLEMVYHEDFRADVISTDGVWTVFKRANIEVGRILTDKMVGWSKF